MAAPAGPRRERTRAALPAPPPARRSARPARPRRPLRPPGPRPGRPAARRRRAGGPAAPPGGRQRRPPAPRGAPSPPSAWPPAWGRARCEAPPVPIPFIPYPTLAPCVLMPSPLVKGGCLFEEAAAVSARTRRICPPDGRICDFGTARRASARRTPSLRQPTCAHRTEQALRPGGRPPGRAPRVQLLELGQAQRGGVIGQLGVGGARAQRVALGRRGAQRRPELLRLGCVRRGAPFCCLLRRHSPVLSQRLL